MGTLPYSIAYKFTSPIVKHAFNPICSGVIDLEWNVDVERFNASILVGVLPLVGKRLSNQRFDGLE